MRRSIKKRKGLKQRRLQYDKMKPTAGLKVPVAKGRPDYFPIVALFIVPGSYFSYRICLCLERQGIRTPLFYIVSAEVLILPSYLTNRWAVRNDNPDIVVAAVEATTQLLAKGSSIERKKLLNERNY